MAKITGNMALPQPTSVENTSQLINDSRFASVYEFVLDSTTLASSDILNINDQVPAKSILYKVELIVLSPIIDPNVSDPIMMLQGNGNILMGGDWNNPTELGTYITDTYYEIAGLTDELVFKHSATSCTNGTVILRLHVYQAPVVTLELETTYGELYATNNTASIEVKS